VIGRLARRCGAGARRLPGLARAHWLFSIVLALGLIGRVLTMAAYWPSLFYIDSLDYLTNRFTLDPTKEDPIGYPLILRVLLDLHQLSIVAALQQLLGLAMGLCIYALLLRKGAPRWLGALAAVPVLLDSYEWQNEQNILSDSVFLAMVTFALTILAWNKRPSWKAVAGVGLILGAASVVRTVGEVTLVPVAVYLLLAAGPSWRRRLVSCGLLAVVCSVPLLAYTAYTSAFTSGNLSKVESSRNLLYGRVATVADCAAMPGDLRTICPPGSVAYRKSLGPDYFAHDPHSPLVTVGAANENAFDRWVLVHQPLAVAGAVGEDFLQLFISPHGQVSGSTPVSRWQFQTSWQVWSPNPRANTNAVMMAAADAGGSGHLDVGLAQALRDYQLGGGYTPSWYFAAAFLAALGALCGVTRRSRGSSGNALRVQVLLWAGTGTALLLGADIFEFSWRYQLPAVVLLPMGGAFGVMSMFNLKQRRGPVPEGQPDAVDTYTDTYTDTDTDTDTDTERPGTSTSVDAAASTSSSSPSSS
jgi:hypothetical protein